MRFNQTSLCHAFLLFESLPVAVATQEAVLILIIVSYRVVKGMRGKMVLFFSARLFFLGRRIGMWDTTPKSRLRCEVATWTGEVLYGHDLIILLYYMLDMSFKSEKTLCWNKFQPGNRKYLEEVKKET